MRSIKPVLIGAVLVMTLLVSGMPSASGHWGGGHHGHWGGLSVGIGWPFWGPSWYYPPYYYPYYSPYYYPPAVGVPSTPPVYIEQAQPAPSSAPSGVWYYCPASRTYYPYVKECPGGWQTVPAQPPSGRQ
jgi:hypothetical protein